MPKITLQHLIAFFVVIVFFIASNIVILNSLSTQDPLIAFGIPMFVGAASSIGFFYIFMREETFPFATIIESWQKKAERRWLKYLPKTGKVATVFLLGLFGGPLLAAFSAQFLIPKYKFRYQALAAVGLVSGFLVVAAAKGLFAGGSAALLHFMAQ